MELAPGGKHKYSFAVIAGINAGEPLSTRAARMKNYNELVRDLDSSGAHYSQELSEVDLSDTDDVKVLAADANGEVLVHLGSTNYLQRYKTYVTHVRQWRQQFDKLESVDLRYDGQIIVNPDLDGLARPPALTPAAVKAAMAAGAKTAPIVNYEKFATQPEPPSPGSPRAPVREKKDARSKLKTAPATTVHRVSSKPALAKPASSKPAAPQLSAKAAPAKFGPPSPVSANQAVQPAAIKTKVKPNAKPKIKTNGSSAGLAVAKPAAALHPDPPVAATFTGQKPSAAIKKETPQN
jgi:cell division protein FtsQ